MHEIMSHGPTQTHVAGLAETVYFPSAAKIVLWFLKLFYYYGYLDRPREPNDERIA